MKLVALAALGAGVFLASNVSEASQMKVRGRTDLNPVDLSEAPRGIRNNNPGNLENNGERWQGLSAIQTDPRFYQFVTPEMGVRALARVLSVYRTRDGLEGLGGPGIDTIREVISRWAPEYRVVDGRRVKENDTEAYIRAVANEMQVSDSVALQPGDYPGLIKAIIRHENGVQPYPDSVINEGIRRAYA